MYPLLKHSLMRKSVMMNIQLGSLLWPSMGMKKTLLHSKVEDKVGADNISSHCSRHQHPPFLEPWQNIAPQEPYSRHVLPWLKASYTECNCVDPEQCFQPYGLECTAFLQSKVCWFLAFLQPRPTWLSCVGHFGGGHLQNLPPWHQYLQGRVGQKVLL